MDIEQIQKDITHLRALCALQSGEISALYLLLAELTRRHGMTLASGEDVADAYVRLRKEMSQQLLENLEDNNPQLAAEISEILGDSSRNYPI